MLQETTMENRSWLKKSLRRFRPGHVVNLCFVVVMIFSTLLTWREIAVLEDAYISSQQNHLDSVANVLDRQLQFNVDKLIFLRNGMHDALITPLDFAVLHGAVTQFEQLRKQRFWQLELDRRRTLSLNGVSDELVDQATLLTRDNANLANELTAALESGYLMRLAHSSASIAHQAMYVSRSGFYVATHLPCTVRTFLPAIMAM